MDDSERTENGEIVFEIPLSNPYSRTLTFWNNIYENYFIDAFSRWQLNTREEDEDDENGVDVDEGSENDDSDDTDDTDNTDEEDGSDDNNDDSPGSASSLVAYTFTIMTLFAILDKFHMLQIAL